MNMIQPSKLHVWADCPRRARYLHDIEAKPPPVTDIRVWIGTAAHALLAEKDGNDQIATPSDCLYDPSERPGIKSPTHAVQIALRVADVARHTLAHKGVKINQAQYLVAHGEWRGCVDFIARDADNRLGLIEFKTGKYHEHHWLQLGAYVVMHDNLHEEQKHDTIIEVPPIAWAGILHVNRERYITPSTKEMAPLGGFHTRDGKELQEVKRSAQSAMSHARAQAEKVNHPAPNPSSRWCATCEHPKCPHNKVKVAEPYNDPMPYFPPPLMAATRETGR